jgi:Family of unknown function (DUF6174)
MLLFPSSRIRTLAMALALGLGACKSSVTGPVSELAAARARWSSVAPTTYSVVIARSCECLQAAAGPVLVTVRNGVAQSRQYTQTGAPVTGSLSERFPTVEGLFAVIDAAIRDRIQPMQVEYDPALGYPTRVFIGDTSADGGEAYFASDVHPQ